MAVDEYRTAVAQLEERKIFRIEFLAKISMPDDGIAVDMVVPADRASGGYEIKRIRAGDPMHPAVFAIKSPRTGREVAVYPAAIKSVIYSPV